MIPRHIAALIARSYWKAALLGLVAVGFVLLPSSAEAHPYQPYDTIIVLTGAGNTLTSRVQIGSRCFNGQPARVFTQVNGGTIYDWISGAPFCNTTTPGTAICTPAIFGNPICTTIIPGTTITYQIAYGQCISSGSGTTTCPPGSGIQSNAGTAECSWYGYTLPPTTWQVTCIFTH